MERKSENFIYGLLFLTVLKIFLLSSCEGFNSKEMTLEVLVNDEKAYNIKHINGCAEISHSAIELLQVANATAVDTSLDSGWKVEYVYTCQSVEEDMIYAYVHNDIVYSFLPVRIVRSISFPRFIFESENYILLIRSCGSTCQEIDFISKYENNAVSNFRNIVDYNIEKKAAIYIPFNEKESLDLRLVEFENMSKKVLIDSGFCSSPVKQQCIYNIIFGDDKVTFTTKLREGLEDSDFNEVSHTFYMGM